MAEWIRKLIKCRLRGVHKFSIIHRRCIRCNYSQDDHQRFAHTPQL